MWDSIEDDWADGIAAAIRELLASGAPDAVVDNFIRARQDGDEELADRLLSAATQTGMAAGGPYSCEGNIRALTNLRVAALRPVVNSMSAEELFRYFLFVQHTSERMAETQAGEAFWRSRSALDAVGKSLARAWLDFTSSETCSD